MADRELFYVKTEDGSEYGPATRDQLVSWASEGRIEPTSRVSSDRVNWIQAPRVPELGMRWLVEIDVGQYCGPFNRAVISELIDQGQLSSEARIFRLEDLEQERKASAEMWRARSDLAAAERHMAEMEQELATLRQRVRQPKKSKGFLSWLFGDDSQAPDLSWLEQAARRELAAVAARNRAAMKPKALRYAGTDAIEVTGKTVDATRSANT